MQIDGQIPTSRANEQRVKQEFIEQIAIIKCAKIDLRQIIGGA